MEEQNILFWTYCWPMEFAMSIGVRPVEDGDISTLAGIRAEEWETSAFWEVRIGKYLRGEHSPQQALPARAGFVAEQDGSIVGFVFGQRTRRYGCGGSCSGSMSPANTADAESPACCWTQSRTGSFNSRYIESA